MCETYQKRDPQSGKQAYVLKCKKNGETHRLSVIEGMPGDGPHPNIMSHRRAGNMTEQT